MPGWQKIFGVARVSIYAVLIGNGSFACGSLTASKTALFNLEILGVLTAPDDAEGNATPISMTLTINEVVMTNTEGDTISLLDTPTEQVIIARPQVVVSKKAKDYEGMTINNLTVTLDGTITAKTKLQDALAVTFSKTKLKYKKDFIFEKGSSVYAYLKIYWLNTLTTDDATPSAATESISSPEVEIILE